FTMTLRNAGKERRRLELYLYVEWVLGVFREEAMRYQVTNFDSLSGCLYVRNNYNADFPGRISFIGSSHEIVGFTTSRQEFSGRSGSFASPAVFDAALAREGSVDMVRLSRRVGAGFDTCGVIKVALTLESGKSEQISMFFGESPSLDQLRKSVSQFS